MGKWTFPFWLASWVGLAFGRTSYPCPSGLLKKGRSMRNGKRRRRKSVWLPVLWGPLDGNDCKLTKVTAKGFEYVTRNGVIHVYRYEEKPTEYEGVVECFYRHVEAR
jgi:hypothetical protein